MRPRVSYSPAVTVTMSRRALSDCVGGGGSRGGATALSLGGGDFSREEGWGDERSCLGGVPKRSWDRDSAKTTCAEPAETRPSPLRPKSPAVREANRPALICGWP